MDLTQEQRETHWLIMAGHYLPELDFENVAYANVCVDKIGVSGRRDEPLSKKRGVTTEYLDHNNNRKLEIAKLLQLGLPRRNAYDILLKNGDLTYEEKSINFVRFGKLCTEVSKIIKVPEKRTRSSESLRLKEAGFTNKQIAAELGMNLKNVCAAIHNAKLKRG